MTTRKTEQTSKSSLKLLLWAAAIAFLMGIVNLSSIPEDMLRTSRNKLHMQKASGDIVLIAIDEKALSEVGRWPWPRREYAKLIDGLTDAGAKQIFFDIVVNNPSNPEDDRLFRDSLKRSGRVILPFIARAGPGSGIEQDAVPLPEFSEVATLGSVTLSYNYQNAVWTLPYASNWRGQSVPSFATLMAGIKRHDGSEFMVDYSITPSSIPVVRASDVIFGKFDPAKLRGKSVIIGVDSYVIGDQYFFPGTGKMGGAKVHVIGAETLKAGEPIHIGWGLGFILALLVCAITVQKARERVQNMVLAGTAATLLIGPAALEARQIYVDVVPALIIITVVATVLSWQRWQSGGLTNAVSGLPNLNALTSNQAGRNQALIAARLLNYAEITAALPPEGERILIDQIVARLSVGSAGRTLYQGDGGIFAWFEDSQSPFANHLEALYALFRNPARVAGLPLDLTISFGVEIGSNRSLGNRLASALVAAEEAAHDGLKWKYHDPETLENASWKLSMLSQLDDAVDKGEIWVAYQPKLDLKTNQVVGAEALARWTHPEKGPIAAIEFIAAAEQHDRIGKLTDFVLEQSIKAAAELNRRQPGFGMAVNVSAKLLSDQGLTLRLAAMLARHGLKSDLLTLELTETAALTDTGSAIEMLASLKEIGVNISIDDYGTGLSTLDYLKKIPANEIKIDQSFVKGMLDNRSDRLMVQSTIGLAHSLDRKVVAEGVESREILTALTEMECDIAQGFIVGRPMSLDSLIKRVAGARKSRVA